jgi:hypothetical protein
LSGKSKISRRDLFGVVGKAAAASVALAPLVGSAIVSGAAAAEDAPLNGIAGIDRVTVLPGKTYLRGWAGYGDPPRPARPVRGAQPEPPPETGPAPTVAWSKDSGPGAVTFADPKSLVTTAAFSTPGAYVLKLTVDNGQTTSASVLNVLVETPPPVRQLDAVYTRNFKIDSPLWNARAKALMVSWIPHCIGQINRTDLTQGPGGIDNFVEAGKALRGEPHGVHKGYVFSNAWVHQTVEAMSTKRCVRLSTIGFPRSSPPRNRMDTYKPLSRCPELAAVAERFHPTPTSIGIRPTAATTKAIPAAISWNRPSTIT